MRKIKFRAWDEQKKIMHKNFQFIRSGTDENDWTIFDSDTEKQKWDGNFNPYFAKQLHIMQYTGLKDKNGVDIYEGDILLIELDWGYGLAKIYCEVYFNNGMFKAKALNSHEDTSLIEMPYLEVIGNIYEHQHLLYVEDSECK